MNVSLLSDSRWTEANLTLRQRLGLADFSGSVFAFQSIYHGLIETVLSLSQLYSHKTELLMPLESGPYWTKLAADCTRLGLRSHVSMGSQIAALIGQKVQAKGLLATFSCDDDPTLGHLYDNSWMASLLAEKVFCLKVIHNSPSDFTQFKTMSPFEGRIVSLANGLAVAVLGDRMKVQPFVAPHCHWAATATVQPNGMMGLSNHRPDVGLRDKILKFEANVAQLGASALLKGDQRSWDRAAISWPDIDGSAIREVLIQQMGCEASGIETLSACRWPLTQNFHWLLEQGFTPEHLRGSLILNAVILNDSRFIDKLTSAVQTVRALQG